MKFQTKAALTILLFSFSIASIFIYWNYLTIRNDAYETAFGYMNLTLGEIIENDIERRQKILTDAKMNSTELFIRAYQAEAIESILTKVSKKEGKVVIVNAENKVLASSQSKIDWPILDTLSVESSPSNYPGYITPEYLVVSTTFKPWEWDVYYLLKRDSVYQSIFQVFKQSIIITSSLLLFVVLATLWAMDKFIVNRISILRDAALLISNHQKVDSIAITSNDDFGILARSMVAMSKNIQQYNKEQKELQDKLRALNQELEKSNSELAALNKNMEEKIRERTNELENVNRELFANLHSIQKELESTKEKRNQLVKKLSELTLNQSDMMSRHADIVRQFKESNEKNLFLRQKINYE